MSKSHSRHRQSRTVEKVTGGVDQESMPFIQIPTAGRDGEEQLTSAGNITTATNPAVPA